MNKFFKFGLMGVACATLLLGPTGATAQDDNPLDPTIPKSKVLVGPRVGLNRNFHTGGFRTIKDPNCPIFESGSGWGFLVGFTAEFIPGETWSIVPAIVYESRPGNFRQELPDAKVLLEEGKDPVTQSVSTTSDITYTLLSAEVMYKQEFAQFGKNFRLSATAGPVAAYVLGGKITQVQDLDAPTNARFINPDPARIGSDRNGTRLIFSQDEEIPGRNSLRFSLKAGLQAEIGLFNNDFMIYPGVFYDYGLSNVTDSENWDLNSILFQLDLRRAF